MPLKKQITPVSPIITTQINIKSNNFVIKSARKINKSNHSDKTITLVMNKWTLSACKSHLKYKKVKKIKTYS